MTGPRYTPLAATLPSTVPFVGPEAQERARARPFRARLGANESLFGPSPKAIAAMAQAASEAWMYGDPEVHNLRTAIAAHHGCTPAHVVVGEGIRAIEIASRRALSFPVHPSLAVPDETEVQQVGVSWALRPRSRDTRI